MSTMEVTKGNRFLHLQHGIGRVQSIEERSFYGSPSARYVQIHFERDDLTVTVLEKDFPDVVRKLISATEAKKLLDELEAWKGKPSTKWKSRANANQAALDSGDPFEYVKVAKGLAQLETQGSLRMSDREHYNLSMDLLTEELACALGKSERQARRMIDKAISA